jgi:hypothetical protein
MRVWAAAIVPTARVATASRGGMWRRVAAGGARVQLCAEPAGGATDGGQVRRRRWAPGLSLEDVGAAAAA